MRSPAKGPGMRGFQTASLSAIRPRIGSKGQHRGLRYVNENSFTTVTSGLPKDVSYDFTSELEMIVPTSLPTRRAFQCVGSDGKLRKGVPEPDIEESTLLDIYRRMVELKVMDHVMYQAQRQGRISFYMQSSGEEATTIGSASALHFDDVVFAQYRECGVLLWRGYTMQNVADQCFGNRDDHGRGRQMPMHYGSKKYNYHTISSPLTTQVPHASGAAYSMRNEGPNGRVVACYFGEGAASEGDFHAGVNFAATKECPILFICRNNQYAISTPIQDQFRGDGIVSRAAGYGMASVRVDGNDVIAINKAIREARAYARTSCKPVLIELMTYRVGHHSTSDDSTAYRATEEIETWNTAENPIQRLKLFLEDRSLWDEAKEKELYSASQQSILSAISVAEDKEKPEPMQDLFDDVYASLPPNLDEQRAELEEMIKRHPKHYTTMY